MVKTILSKLISFGMAFAAGWWGVRERVNPWAGGPVSAPSSRPAGQRSKDQPVTADGLVAKHTAKKPGDQKKAQAEKDHSLKSQEEQKRKFESLKDSFVLDSDPAKQYQAAMERYAKNPEQWAELQLISLAWLRQDADGFLAFLAKGKGEGSGSGLYWALKERCMELLREQKLELLGKLEAAKQLDDASAMLIHLASDVLASGKFEDAIALADQLQPRQRGGFMVALATQCPEPLRPQAFKWFADQGRVDCIRQLASFVGRERASAEGSPGSDNSWFREMVERFPETRENLANSGLYQQLMTEAWARLPFEQGLAEMVAGMPDSLSDEAKRAKAIEQLCNQVTATALGMEWNRQQVLGDGRCTVEQIVERMGASAQQLFAAAPDEMRKAIFPELAMRDPETAVKMVASLEPKVREQLVLKAAANPMLLVEGDAERLLNMFTALPPSKEQGPLQARFMAWGQITNNAYRTYGDSYPAWLLALPNSVNRDMALSQLAMSVKGTDPELGARLLAAKSQAPPAQ